MVTLWRPISRRRTHFRQVSRDVLHPTIGLIRTAIDIGKFARHKG